MKRLLALVAVAAMALGVAGPVAAATEAIPSSPTSTTQEVQPYLLRQGGQPVGPGGNVTCGQLGDFAWQSDKVDFTEEMAYTDVPMDIYEWVNGMKGDMVGTVLVSYDPDTKRVDFSANVPIEAAIVKGGADANVYDYRPDGVTLDTGLGAPPNASGGSAGLSNLTFCTNPFDNPPSNEWCSPGYWRQPHHLGSWEATGYSPDELYSNYFGTNTLSKKAGIGADPTLWEVLQSPQTFGGTAFNNVGDLLSAAHPDVMWDGMERTEDSCPLS